MADPEEIEPIEEPLEDEEENIPIKQQATASQPEESELKIPESADKEELGVTQQIEVEEKLIEPKPEPMELELTEAVPKRRTGFVSEAVNSKIKQFHLDPKETSVEVGEKTVDIVKNHGTSMLHYIPGLGLLAALFSKRQVGYELQETTEQFSVFNRGRMKILKDQPRSALDIARGQDPIQFWEANESRGVNLLLANTLEYAQVQLQKRFRKLEVKGVATDLQTVGAGAAASIVGVPIGAAFSLTGSIVKGAISFKSIGNFFRKLWNRTLGVERSRHAQLLYGLALEHMAYEKQIAAPRHIESVNQSLNYVSTLGPLNGRKEAQKKAYELLHELGAINDPDRFTHRGFKDVMNLLKS